MKDLEGGANTGRRNRKSNPQLTTHNPQLKIKIPLSPPLKKGEKKEKREKRNEEINLDF
jgi:hypothetical protein